MTLDVCRRRLLDRHGAGDGRVEHRRVGVRKERRENAIRESGDSRRDVGDRRPHGRSRAAWPVPAGRENAVTGTPASSARCRGRRSPARRCAPLRSWSSEPPAASPPARATRRWRRGPRITGRRRVRGGALSPSRDRACAMRLPATATATRGTIAAQDHQPGERGQEDQARGEKAVHHRQYPRPGTPPPAPLCPFDGPPGELFEPGRTPLASSAWSKSSRLNFAAVVRRVELRRRTGSRRRFARPAPGPSAHAARVSANARMPRRFSASESRRRSGPAARFVEHRLEGSPRLRLRVAVVESVAGGDHLDEALGGTAEGELSREPEDPAAPDRTGGSSLRPTPQRPAVLRTAASPARTALCQRPQVAQRAGPRRPPPPAGQPRRERGASTS